MDDVDDSWSRILKEHPIFDPQKDANNSNENTSSPLELSLETLPQFLQEESINEGLAPSGRRQTMILKDTDLIVASGCQIRIASLSDAKLGGNNRQTYKILHTPNVQFPIHQICLNPSGKLLAVTGTFQVAIIVLPRPGYSKLVNETIDCKSIQVGQFYHASNGAAPISKIDWHPWGEAGSTLMVMTVDGKLREYDLSVDTEEPLQVLSFVPERKLNASFLAEDPAEREVSSFTLGKGEGDWGPLTIYALMKSGDMYAICPYIPQNVSIPSSYIHSLECFVAAKQDHLAHGSSSTARDTSSLYDYQHKYISALVKQLPPGTIFPSPSRSVVIHPPTTFKTQAALQGPFLLQPSPRMLDGSEGGSATDLIYLSFDEVEEDEDEDSATTEHLGVIMLGFQDGKLDVFLDVEKVEAKWENKTQDLSLPMLAVYETIDLGLITSLRGLNSKPNTSPLNLLQGNHPVFFADPIHKDTAYVYHAFGVHVLNIGPMLQHLAAALRGDDNADGSLLESSLRTPVGTSVQPILSTFSIENCCSNPIIGVTIPNDIYLTYRILILTSSMRFSSFPLSLRTEATLSQTLRLASSLNKSLTINSKSKWLTPLEGPPAYVSLLKDQPYKIPKALERSTGLPKFPQLSLPPSTLKDKEFKLTPDTLRYFGTVTKALSSQILEVILAVRTTETHISIQKEELSRMAAKGKEIEATASRLRGSAKEKTEARFKELQDKQKSLLSRMDRQLQSLMERASPELSEHETKWFEELKRMKTEIQGMAKYDEGSLLSRVRTLEREYDRLMPNLKELVAKERKRRDKLEESNRALGFSQAFELGERSNFERSRISEIQHNIVKLASKLDVSLQQPPPSP